MALSEKEAVAAVAATAAAMSPRVRKVARSGLVYGLAGALQAGDVARAAARGVARAVAQEPQTGGSSGAAPKRSPEQPSAGSRPQRAVRGRAGAGEDPGHA